MVRSIPRHLCPWSRTSTRCCLAALLVFFVCLGTNLYLLHEHSWHFCRHRQSAQNAPVQRLSPGSAGASYPVLARIKGPLCGNAGLLAGRTNSSVSCCTAQTWVEERIAAGVPAEAEADCDNPESPLYDNCFVRSLATMRLGPAASPMNGLLWKLNRWDLGTSLCGSNSGLSHKFAEVTYTYGGDVRSPEVPFRLVHSHLRSRSGLDSCHLYPLCPPPAPPPSTPALFRSFIAKCYV